MSSWPLRLLTSRTTLVALPLALVTGGVAVASPDVDLVRNRAFEVVSPADGDRVGEDFLLSWTGSPTGTYAVVVDARVPGPGQLVTPGDHVLTLTGQALRLTLGPLTGGSPSARHQHTVVVVPLDSAGRRRGEQVALVHVRDAS